MRAPRRTCQRTLPAAWVQEAHCPVCGQWHAVREVTLGVVPVIRCPAVPHAEILCGVPTRTRVRER